MTDEPATHAHRPEQEAVGARNEPYKEALDWLRSAVGGPPGWWHAAYAAVMAAADAEHASLRAGRDRWKCLAFQYEMAAGAPEQATPPPSLSRP